MNEQQNKLFQFLLAPPARTESAHNSMVTKRQAEGGMMRYTVYDGPFRTIHHVDTLKAFDHISREAEIGLVVDW